MTRTVLDASVVLAVVQGEPGHERILQLAEPGCISTVNLAEARSKLADKGLDAETIELTLGMVRKSVFDFTDDDSKAVAVLRAGTRAEGLSLGDRACLALAQRLGAVALTADKSWSRLSLPVEIQLIR